ncbi:hypothetical protein [Paenibacillus macerans]|uniref:hypothetical protein n=1 Tax=Paenibacillus macerans TaxID=44252 RepID=UPI003D310325
MRLNELKLDLSVHAHEQYRDRVKDVTFTELKEICRSLLASGEYIRDGQFIQINDAWWVFNLQQGNVLLITCYGSSHLDIPRALAWAKKHNDRIDLEQCLLKTADV